MSSISKYLKDSTGPMQRVRKTDSKTISKKKFKRKNIVTVIVIYMFLVAFEIYYVLQVSSKARTVLIFDSGFIEFISIDM